MNKLTSTTIRQLRLPLCLMVVCTHARFVEVAGGKQLLAEGCFPVYTAVSTFISDLLVPAAVPLFFFISGYLFFQKPDAIFSRKIYVCKLKRRVGSLLIPYLFWNLAALVFFCLADLVFPEMRSGNTKSVINYDAADFLRAFYDTADADTSHPICLQLWFVRDLMVVVVASPLVWLLLWRLRLAGLAALGLLWFSDLSTGIDGVSTVSFFFFSFGAYFSIANKDFITAARRAWPYALFIFSITSVVCLLNLYNGNRWLDFLYNLNIIAVMILMVAAVAAMAEKEISVGNGIISANFFIYACHLIPLVTLKKMTLKLFTPDTDCELLLLYFGCQVVIVAFCVYVYRLLKRLLPLFTAVIVGERV